jgi:choline dehydrogenase-like flavoprotein
LKMPILGAFKAPKNDEHRVGPLQTIHAPMKRFDNDEEVDYLIVGVGSAGGVLLQRLARACFKVVGMEAGPFWDTERDWVSDESGSHKHNDKKLIAAAKKKTEEVMWAAAATTVVQESRYAHLVGGCRMGSDPETSVVDKFGRSHDVANLFVCDGSVFPTQGSANPGLTIQALAARTADYHLAG